MSGSQLTSISPAVLSTPAPATDKSPVVDKIAPSQRNDAVFGHSKSIQLIEGYNIQIRHKATFQSHWCWNSLSAQERQYLFVLENGIEMNRPKSCCCLLPANDYCIHNDLIEKFYFDRGIWEIRPFFCSYFLRGSAHIHVAESRYICCCMKCPVKLNRLLSCYFPSLCGDRLRIVPCEGCCLCCSNKTSWVHNCCGICGLDNGQPLCFSPISLVSFLAVGTADELAKAIKTARDEWRGRVAANAR